jgi:hypothetical protein
MNFVFGRPSGLRPSFHSPRDLINLTRSKRLRTLRFFPVLPPVCLRLLCCDIEAEWVLWSAEATGTFGKLQPVSDFANYFAGAGNAASCPHSR